MEYLSATTESVLIGIFVFFGIFFIVDLVQDLFLSFKNRLDDEDDTKDINIFIGHDLQPIEKIKIKK